MATLGFTMSEDDKKVVCSAFAAPDCDNYINYRELLKRIDA
jgi:hypothetical protein